MRKIVSIVLSYIIFSAVVCLALSFFVFKQPELMSYDVCKYKLLQGLLHFFKFLPAIAAGGFLVTCSVFFSSVIGKYILDHFKKVILTSVFFVAMIFIVEELVTPIIQRKQLSMENTPVVFNDFILLSKKSLDEGHFALAAKYAGDALEIDQNSAAANELFEKALAEKELESSFKDGTVQLAELFAAETGDDFSQIQASPYSFSASNNLSNETVSSLLEKSRKAMKDGLWFDAHYYAYLAMQSGKSENRGFNDAKEMAENSWNKILTPTDFSMSEEMEIFALKRRAYLRLLNGDNLSAYYGFLKLSRLSEKTAKDPDIKKYLEIAKENLQTQFFFIDEVENFKKFETDNNVYFSIPHENGTIDIVHISGVTPIRDSGRTIQYLRGFSLFTYDDAGNFIRSVSAPYAKMVSEEIECFDDKTKSFFGLNEDYKTVPYIFLKGIDSESAKKVSLPEFNFNPSVSEIDKAAFENIGGIILCTDYSDFNYICESSSGADKMGLISLWKFFRKAERFGYSSELFGATLIHRLTNPLIMLIIFVFLACIAWSYKLQEGQIFKFKWILLVPACTVILYFLIEVMHFVMRALNYFLIGFAGNYAVLIAMGVELLLLFIVSSVFVSKK